MIPIEDNPLVRWSQRIPSKWKISANTRTLAEVTVGVEGCESAFNATNVIRSCWFFQTGLPPTFLSLKGWEGIEHLQERKKALDKNESNTVSKEEDAEDEFVFDESCVGVKGTGAALFGEKRFFDMKSPLIVLENYADNATSIFRCRIPYEARLVMGHENGGVRAELKQLGCTGTKNESESVARTPASHKVVYIPQYGTISSLNVVTALGIGLFYAFLDFHFPQSRSLVTQELTGKEREEFRALVDYHDRFHHALPSSCDEKASRVDPRPIHPIFYKKNAEEVSSALKAHREKLLECSLSLGGEAPYTAGGKRFGLSVLYENDFDQRNFGGLIRNANAFLVDQVLYLGRKKFNVVGSVGCYHYTPPLHLGPVFDSSSDMDSDQDKYSAAIKEVLSSYDKVDEQKERIIRLTSWSLNLRGAVTKACEGDSEWWLLDCGHQSLYAEDYESQKTKLKELQTKSGSSKAVTLPEEPYKSSLESLLWFLNHISNDQFVLSLTHPEEKIRAAAEKGVVLVIPQEGKLPHISILMQCVRILTVVPPLFEGENAGILTGMPTQVASGIALQRLSSILHPSLSRL